MVHMFTMRCVCATIWGVQLMIGNVIHGYGMETISLSDQQAHTGRRREKMKTTHALLEPNPVMTFLAFVEELSIGSESGKKGRAIIAMGKRANGEGSVYHRPDKKHKKWVASITLENGKRKQIYCETQAEAVKELRKLNQAKDEGTLITENAALGQC